MSSWLLGFGLRRSFWEFLKTFLTAADPCDHRREQSWDWYWSFVLVVFLVGGLGLVLGCCFVFVVVVIVIVVAVVVVGLLLGFVLQCGLFLCCVWLVVLVWVFYLAEFVVCVVLIWR